MYGLGIHETTCHVQNPIHFYHPQMKFGAIFTGICLSTAGGAPDRDPPDRDPPGQRPRDRDPPLRYTSYWNASLLMSCLCQARIRLPTLALKPREDVTNKKFFPYFFIRSNVEVTLQYSGCTHIDDLSGQGREFRRLVRVDLLHRWAHF